MSKTNSQLSQAERDENLRRSDMALADLARDGGMLPPEAANRFIDFIQEEPTILRQARTIRMNGPQRKVDSMGFDKRILRAGRQVGGARDDGGNDRYVRAADRAAPRTRQVELNTSEVIAEIRLPYEVLEDNIEGGNFEAHVLRLMAQRVAVDLEELSLWGRSNHMTDPYLALQDGFMYRAMRDGNVLDNNGQGINPDLFANALLTMPQVYLRLLPQLRAYTTHANRIKFLQNVSKRQTGYGDSALQNNIPVTVHGLTLEAANMLATEEGGEGGLVTFPQNLLYGIQRNITIETDRDIRSREIIIVLTARVAFQIDDPNAVVRLMDIGGYQAPALNVNVVNLDDINITP